MLEDDALFCSECGEKQEPVENKCQHCGASLMEGAKFCMNCGTPVAIEVASDPAKHSQTQNNGSADYEITEIDENTLSFNIMGIPFNMKLIRGGMLNNNIELSDFYIGETVVTQALWQTVMGDNPSKDNSNLKFPVTNVNTQLCKSFLVRLKKITGVSFALPTWSQFKYAAFKGSEKMDDSAFDETRWGNKALHPVCGMISNALGLYDLSDWTQLVADEGADTFGQYCFNPRYGRNIFSLRLKGLNKTVYATGPERLPFCTLRLSLNIPVDPKVEQYKKKLEKKGGLNKTMASTTVPDIPVGHPLESIFNKRQQQYTQAQQKLIDEENKRLEEEAKRKEEEERLKREKEEKRKAEALKKREEAKRKKEEEARKKEEQERLKAEERARKEEEKRKKQEEKRRYEAEHPEIAEARKMKLEERKKQQAQKEKEAAERKAAEEAKRKAKEAAIQKAIQEAKRKIIENDSLYPVDLGLSVKWASVNLGASKPYDFGEYYAWGETDPKDEYNWEEYELTEESDNANARMFAKVAKRPEMAQEILKYCTDSERGEVDVMSVLKPEDDAASVNMRSKLRFWEKNKWRMATIEEWNELQNKCEWYWTTINGHNGYVVIAKNGNCIFLPAAGYKSGNKLNAVNSAIRYWSSSLNKEINYEAHEINECPDNPLAVINWNSYRYLGLSVRAVQD